MPSIAIKRLLRRTYKKHSLSSFQKTKSTQTSGSDFRGRIEQVKKPKNQLELIEIIDRFLDGHGNYTSDLVSFKFKFLWINHILNSKDICIYNLAVQMK